MSDYLPSFIVEPVRRQARRFSERRGGEDLADASPVLARSTTVPAPATDFEGAYSRFHLARLPALPTVPVVDLHRFNPTRFWNQSPPITAADIRGSDSPGVATEDEDADITPPETTLQSIARNIQLWANQINNLDIVPSPPLEPIPDAGERAVPSSEHHSEISDVIEFPPLDVDTPQPSLSDMSDPRLRHGDSSRNNSETSLNPAQELPYRSMVLATRENGRSQSDPLAAPNIGEQGLVMNSDNAGEENQHRQRRDGSEALPEDDGMGPLRKRITAIWAGPGTPQEKSKLVHLIMTERYQSRQSQAKGKDVRLDVPTSPNFRATSPSNLSIVSQDVVFNLSTSDLEKTYAPGDDSGFVTEMDSRRELGCIHYKRNVKMQCATCERWYTCRLCHDEIEDHQLPRRDTKHMLCMLCKTPQRVGQECQGCGVQAACYYCSICKLWNNDPAKSIYHCDDCGICRLGKGLGKDFFHCKRCAACMSIQAEVTHKCIERSTKCDCPICGEYMFTSNNPVAFMSCGHSIHEKCFMEWCNTSYKCPICSKSIANMESQFRRLDRHIEDQPMPEEYRGNRAYIFCNDCNSRSVTKYHWLGLKCTVCESYNTAQLELLGAESPQIQENVERALELGVGEAGITASQSQTPTGELTEATNGLRNGYLTSSPAASRPTTGNSGISDLMNSASATGSIRSSPMRRDSPFHIAPHSPPVTVSRGASPLVGNYFNTGRNRADSDNRRGSYFSVFSMGSTAPTDDSASAVHRNDGRSHGSSANPIATESLQSREYGNPPELLSPDPHPQFGSAINLRLLRGEGATSANYTDPMPVIPRRGATPLDDDDDLDFWGGQSPRSYDAELVDAPGHDGDSIGTDDSDDSDDDDFDNGARLDRTGSGAGDHDDDDDDEDEDEDDDLMDLIGHR